MWNFIALVVRYLFPDNRYFCNITVIKLKKRVFRDENHSPEVPGGLFFFTVRLCRTDAHISMRRGGTENTKNRYNLIT